MTGKKKCFLCYKYKFSSKILFLHQTDEKQMVFDLTFPFLETNTSRINFYPKMDHFLSSIIIIIPNIIFFIYLELTK